MGMTMKNSHTETIQFIDQARKLEAGFADLGDLETAALLAGIADSEEYYLNLEIDNEWRELTLGWGA